MANKELNQRVDLLVLKMILNKYLSLLKFMLILNVFWRKLMVILSVVQIVHIQENIKIMFLAVLLIK